MNKKDVLVAVYLSVLIFTTSMGGFFTGYSIAKNMPVKTTAMPVIADAVEKTMPCIVNLRIEYNSNAKIAGASGVIIRKDGYIITNRHVIKNASLIEVKDARGALYKAKVIGIDSMADLAVLKIAAKVDNLPVAKIGNSSKLRTGDWVIAVGNPLGYGQTVTQGIISAINRKIKEIPLDIDFIQTDAAINPGNSGGPLINSEGEIIGIITAIRSDAQNISFAIPINTAINAANSIIRHGNQASSHM